MKRSQTSFALLSLAVVLPLLLLSALAWIGIRSQTKHGWSTARELAENEAASIAREFARTFESAERMARPSFPDPPLPGPLLSPDDPLLGDNIEKLRAIRDGDDNGVTPAGLPKRALAASRLFEQTRGRSDAEAAIRIAVEIAPSVITPKILERIASSFPDLAGPAQAAWTESQTLRSYVTAHSQDLGKEGKFILSGENIPWIALRGDRIHFVRMDLLQLSREIADRKIAPWAAVRVIVNNSQKIEYYDTTTTHGVESSPPPALGAADVPFGKGMRIEVVAKEPSLVSEAARSQARWTLSMLSFSIMTALIGLGMIHRVIQRERRLNALKSDFVASVSHELRAPIASIRLMADALEDGKIQSNTANEFHRLISREGARLSTLIENVLDFARIEQGRKEWHREESDLRKLILDTVSLMEPLASEKGISIQTDLPDEASALIDSDAIRQALVNLIDNAVKFSPKDSSVKISLSGNEIRITDEGPGIPQAEHRRIFEKFHRLGGELRRETQGTGIGLSLVKAIAEAHGGSVTVESEPGKGSTFILTLPNA